jgi:hypothetical protein
MKAIVTYVDEMYGPEMIRVNGHHIQYGGAAGDGFCYEHQSFDCVENLTDEERQAVKVAERA